MTEQTGVEPRPDAVVAVYANDAGMTAAIKDLEHARSRRLEHHQPSMANSDAA